MRTVALVGLLAGGLGIFAGASLLTGGAAWAAEAPKAEDCLACHADRELKRGTPAPGRPASLFVDHEAAKASAHGRLECVACHKTATAPHEALPRVRCAACHRAQVAAYRDSVHGKSRGRGDLEAATCRSCHGTSHELLARSDPQAPTYHLNLPRTCAVCHADPALAKRHNITIGNVYQLYMDSIHGRAVSKSGLLVAANCSDCHGAHQIKPRT